MHRAPTRRGRGTPACTAASRRTSLCDRTPLASYSPFGLSDVVGASGFDALELDELEPGFVMSCGRDELLDRGVVPMSLLLDDELLPGVLDDG